VTSIVIRTFTVLSANAEAQLPPEQPQAAEGTRNAAALWAGQLQRFVGPAFTVITDVEASRMAGASDAPPREYE